MKKTKLIRISTIPISLNILLKGQLKFLTRYFELTAISGSGNDLDEVGEREGVKIFPIEIQRQISPFKDFVSLIKLYRYFKKEKPDIIHSLTPKAGLLSMLAGRAAGVPVRMHTFTGLVFPNKSGIMQKLLINMDRLLCSAATHIYPEGQGVKNDLIKYKITSKPLKIPANGSINGIDSEYFSLSRISDGQKNDLKKELNIEPDDFVFVFVGRLVGDKGINELINAFKNLNKQNLKLLLVGPYENELDPLLPETLNEIENNKNIISAGFQKDVRPYFAVSDALVFPSYREGFPNVVMQAGAMELPAIVTNINGCNEIIREGVNGIIIPARNEDALKNAMQKMMTDNDYRTALKNNARQMIISRYEQKTVWEALFGEYESLIKSKNI